MKKVIIYSIVLILAMVSCKEPIMTRQVCKKVWSGMDAEGFEIQRRWHSENNIPYVIRYSDEPHVSGVDNYIKRHLENGVSIGGWGEICTSERY